MTEASWPRGMVFRASDPAEVRILRDCAAILEAAGRSFLARDRRRASAAAASSLITPTSFHHPCLSLQTGLATAFKLMIAAQVKWRKLDGLNQLPEITQGVELRDGLRQLQTAD